MASIPVPDVDPEGPYGLPWRRVFTIRNAIARKWYRQFHREIPLEEFLSEANLVIAQAVRTFRAESPGSFASYLWRLMDRRMLSVVRREWAGSIEPA